MKIKWVNQSKECEDMFAFCEECGWKGHHNDLAEHEKCPQCNSSVGICEICPECSSPDKTEEQAAYLLDDKKGPCEQCQKALGIEEFVDQL